MDLNATQLIPAIFIGLAAGYLGSFMILRRMALVGDALSHVALPGLAIALVFNINPFLGAFSSLLIGILAVWLIENKTELSTESLIGLFFTFSLAVGILITPREDILDALFGDISRITMTDAYISIALSLILIIAMAVISKRFILSTLSSDLAKSSGIKVEILNLIFLILVAVVVALGIKAIGTLLMGALVIIPAITSRNLTQSLKSYTITSATLGLISLVGGIILANQNGLPSGPIVVLVSTGIFLVSLVIKK